MEPESAKKCIIERLDIPQDESKVRLPFPHTFDGVHTPMNAILYVQIGEVGGEKISSDLFLGDSNFTAASGDFKFTAATSG